MTEVQLRTVQSQAMQWIRTASIGLVPNNGMAAFSEMNPDLVLTACLKPHFNQRHFRIRLEDSHVCYSKLPCP